ncbi:MAG: hypothetical protein ACJ790_08675 [Myxococcaceae bacterium]
MVSRAVAIALTILLSAQAVASGATVMVCRYTGKVLQDCPCPAATDDAQIQKQGCCELRGSTVFHVDSIVRSAAHAPERVDIVMPRWIALAGTALARTTTRDTAARAPPEDDGRRYLRLQLLLI